MNLPNTYTDKNETGCCPVPNTGQWDKQEMVFKNEHFIRLYTKSFLFMPLNMEKVMKQLNETAESAGAIVPPQQAMILSAEVSPFKAEQLYKVIGPVKGADNVILNGTFVTQVFEGPYKNANKWYKTLKEYAKGQGYSVKKTYFFYTTCPNCAKHYGKNYVIGLAEV